MSIHIEQLTFNGFQENTYVVDDGSICVIVDPGCYERAEQLELTNYIENKGLTPVAVLLTHSHIDHVLGLSYVTENYQIPFFQHESDCDTLSSVSSYAHVYGFGGYVPPKSNPKIIDLNERLQFGEIIIRTAFTPGHAPGHVVYIIDELNAVINGDVLFAGSFGRVDLPGGDMETLKDSIFNVMFKLPENMIVYCGHGPSTIIGKEKMSNYILQF